MDELVKHDIMIFVLGYLSGKGIELVANKLADWYTNYKVRRQPVKDSLTLPEYYGNPYHREPTHVEKVSAMLDRLEEVKYDRR